MSDKSEGIQKEEKLNHPFWTTLRANKKALEIAALLMVIIVGLIIRLEDIRDWQQQPDIAFYQGEPVLTNFDGYYYLTLARDLVEGTYNKVDEKRAVPDGIDRPSPPPLMSVMAAAVAKVTPFSMSWIGAVFPAVVGVLLALPLFGLGRYYGGAAMGLTAALMGLVSHYYVYRSNLGWFDTDCMNITWAMISAWCFLNFGVKQTSRRYLYFAAGLVNTALFLWWWDMTTNVVIACSAVPMAVALIFYYRPKAREGKMFLGVMAALLLALLIWKGFDLPVKVVKGVYNKYSYISKEQKTDFPNIGVTISEQEKPSFKEIVDRTTNSTPVLLLSGAGLILLAWRKRKSTLFLAVPVILSILPFLFAKRFLIFLTPVSALGLGFLAAELWALRKRWHHLTWLTPLLILLMAYPAFKKGMDATFWPKERIDAIHAMNIASKETGKDSVLWAWWDHGYPIIYWARRGGINDGSVHHGERTVYNGVPLATSDSRLSANFMQFYVKRGVTGMRLLYQALDNDRAVGFQLAKDVLAAGPEKGRELLAAANLKPVKKWQTTDDWLRFFFPPDPREVNLLLDFRLHGTAYWWYWLGSWDISKQDGTHPNYQKFIGARLTDRGIEGTGLAVNPADGKIRINNSQNGQLSQLVVYQDHPPKSKDFQSRTNLRLDMFPKWGFAALQGPKIQESVFAKLFIHHQYEPEYFTPIALNAPLYQIWRITGDQITIKE